MAFMFEGHIAHLFSLRNISFVLKGHVANVPRLRKE